MQSFNNHLKMTSINLMNKNIVNRSSAIFPFLVNPKIDTKIHFLSYWFIKRNISDISFVMTVRSKNGKLLYRNLEIINHVKSNEISIKKILKKTNMDFNSAFFGSIELEFLSKKNLVFPFPAVIINMISNSSSAFVHTCGRIYNDIYDKKINSYEIVPESGFDILPNESLTPFFSFVNGPNELKNHILNLNIQNYRGNIFNKKILLKKLKKYETKFIFFLSKKEKNFLENQKGTVSIKHRLTEFFPRFLAGNMDIKKTISSLTHTYYDLTKTKKKNIWVNQNPKIFFDSIFSFPLFIKKNYYNELAIYPIFSKCEMNLDLQIINNNGNLIFEKKSFQFLKKINKKIIYINLNKHFEYLNLNKRESYFVRVIVNANSKPLTRFKVGLNIGLQKKKLNIPTNICFNSILPDKNIVNKQGTFKWAPILDVEKSLICLSNINYFRKDFKDAKVIMKIWSQNNSKFLIKKISIKDNGNRFISFKKNLKVKKFLNEKSGWITFQCDNPFVNGFYFENQNNGFIGGDHLF